MSILNKRAMERFDLEIATHIEAGAEDEGQSIDVVTKDVCSGGAFFQTGTPLPRGTEVKVDLVMPISELKKIEADSVSVTVSGEVIRSDGEGMAVCFDRKYRITPLKG